MAFLLSLAPAAVVFGAELSGNTVQAAVVDTEVFIAEMGAVLAIDQFRRAAKLTGGLSFVRTRDYRRTRNKCFVSTYGATI